MENLIIDTHAHYDDERYAAILKETLAIAKSGSVDKIITCGCDIPSSENAVSIANKFDFVYAAVGYHPQNVADLEFEADKLYALAKEKTVVAIGEIGLDYYWDNSFKEKQKDFFVHQLDFARNTSLPVLVHDREAHADTLEILKHHKPAGVVHCFSGSAEMAEEILRLGMYIGIGGVLTFKNAKKLIEVAKTTPIDRILLETDAPYLAPEPFRGKTNNSAYIIYVAERLAKIKKMSTEAVLKATKENAERLFGF